MGLAGLALKRVAHPIFSSKRGYRGKNSPQFTEARSSQDLVKWVKLAC